MRPARYTKRDGTIMEPMRFIHPCYVDGCDNEACQGVGVALLRGKPGLWACPEHFDGLLNSERHTVPEPTEADDASSNDDSDLFTA